MEGAVRLVSARKRMLIADDDQDICVLLQAVLAPLCDLTIVHDAESALTALVETAFDGLITDYMLPGITGLELVERIRRSERIARLPILMMSGHGAVAIGPAARAAGADAFLSKPFTLAQLRGAVGGLLGPAAQLRSA